MNRLVFLLPIFFLSLSVYTYADSRLIRDLDMLDVYTYNFNASHWIEQGNLQKGVSMYGEIDVPVIDIPARLAGADFLQTSVSSNNFSGKVIAYFVAGEAASLYIAHSDQVKKKPKWLSDYSSVNEFVKTAQGSFELFKKDVKKGDTISLGNNGSTKAPMYFVIAQAKHNLKTTLPKGKIFDIRDFGAIGDNKTINTRSIQAAIDKCAASKEPEIGRAHV